jgi:hypothetical protein
MTDPTTHQLLTALLDRVPVEVDKDLSSVRESAESQVAGRTPMRQDVIGRRSRPRDGEPTRRRRIGVAAVALGIALASTLYVVRAFDSPQPAASTPSSASPSASEATQPGTVGGSYLPPYLAGGDGWNSRSSGPVPATGQNGTVAWASTIPISEEDVRLRAAFPPTTITELPADGIVVTVEVVPSAFHDASVPFPYADISFDLATATRRGPEAEEPPGNYSVLQTENSDAATLVRVYFGSPDPSPELIAKAQAELDTLQLPPTCTTGGPGSYAISVSSTTASPGDVLTLTGTVPFQREDGSFDESGSGRMVAWWNVEPKDWPYLSFGLPSPLPAVDGQGIAELGHASTDKCTFSIPFAVPEAAPSAYPVVVVQEGGGGATLEGSVTIRVTN